MSGRAGSRIGAANPLTGCSILTATKGPREAEDGLGRPPRARSWLPPLEGGWWRCREIWSWQTTSRPPLVGRPLLLQSLSQAAERGPGRLVKLQRC